MGSKPTVKWNVVFRTKHEQGTKPVVTVHQPPLVALDEANEWFWNLPTGLGYFCECGNLLRRILNPCWFCNAGLDKLPPDFGEHACNVFRPFLKRYGNDCLTHTVPDHSTPEMRSKVTEIFGPGGVGHHCFIAAKRPAVGINFGLYPHVKEFIRHVRKAFSGRNVHDGAMISNFEVSGLPSTGGKDDNER